MSKWFYGLGFSSVLTTLGQGSTMNFPLSGRGQGGTGGPESNAQVLIRDTFTASNLWMNVISITGTLTLTDRKNGGAGSQSLSITTSGTKEDTSNKTSLASGDLYNGQGVMSNSHTNSVTFVAFSVLLDDSGVGSSIYLAQDASAGLSNTSSQFFMPLGDMSSSVTEADAQTNQETSALLSNFRVNIVTNAATVTTTYVTRVNGAQGGQSISVAAGVTGSKEDTSGQDNVNPGDLFNYNLAIGTNGQYVLSTIQVKVLSALSLAEAGSLAAKLSGGSGDQFVFIRGRLLTETEAHFQAKARAVDTWSYMQAHVTANTLSVAATADLRVNTASPSGGPSVSIPSTTTGIVLDKTGVYITAVTDLLCYRLNAGSGGTGSITLSALGCQQGVQILLNSQGQAYPGAGLNAILRY